MAAAVVHNKDRAWFIKELSFRTQSAMEMTNQFRKIKELQRSMWRRKVRSLTTLGWALSRLSVRRAAQAFDATSDPLGLTNTDDSRESQIERNYYALWRK